MDQNEQTFTSLIFAKIAFLHMPRPSLLLFMFHSE